MLGIFVEDLSQPLADCLVRLTGLLATPRAIPVLYPAIMREICFWMLTGPNGGEVCKLVLPDSQTRRIADAIHLLRDNFTEPVRIEQLAAAARMSPSSFHQHFKTLTSMTPLQYQKQLRLLEARRLMVAGSANVAERRLSGRLRKRLAVQPRIRPHVRHAAEAGCGGHAGGSGIQR